MSVSKAWQHQGLDGSSHQLAAFLPYAMPLKVVGIENTRKLLKEPDIRNDRLARARAKPHCSAEHVMGLIVTASLGLARHASGWPQ
jgi:hypothetical protein